MFKTTTRTGQTAYVAATGFLLKAARSGEGYRVELPSGTFSWAPTLKAGTDTLSYLSSTAYTQDEAARVQDMAAHSASVRECVLHPIHPVA